MIFFNEVHSKNAPSSISCNIDAFKDEPDGNGNNGNDVAVAVVVNDDDNINCTVSKFAHPPNA